MLNLVIMVLAVAGSASLTRLAMHDEITAPIRRKLYLKYGETHFVNRMLECERCTSVWATPGVLVPVLAGYVWFTPFTWWMALVAFLPLNMALSYLGFLLLRRGE
jgi:hypothetical protein